MKKLISGILAAAVACGSALCLSTSASAAGDNGYALSASFDKAETEKGDTFTMTVSLDENPGLMSLRFRVKYDPAAVAIEENADITALEDFGVPGSFTAPKANNEAGTVLLRWNCPLATENITKTGALAAIKFTVKSDAPIGSTGISIEPVEINMIDEDMNRVNLEEKYGTGIEGYFKTPSETDIDKLIKIICTHDWDDGTVTAEPTCNEKGVRTFTCSICGETETEEINALGHAWNNGTVTTEPTCTEKGVKTIACTRCNETKTEEIEALGHTWDNGTVTTEPTCTEKGVKTIACARCNETKTEEIEALGHTWDNGTVTTEPTCTEKGVKTFTCTVCGDTKTEETAALGHDWGEWTVTKEATPDEEGEETRECKTCGDTEVRAIEKLTPEITTTKYSGMGFDVPETTTSSAAPAESETVSETTADTTVYTSETTAVITAASSDNTPADIISGANDNTGTYDNTVSDTASSIGIGNVGGNSKDDKNRPTGIILTVIPAAAAAIGVLIFKKRK